MRQICLFPGSMLASSLQNFCLTNFFTILSDTFYRPGQIARPSMLRRAKHLRRVQYFGRAQFALFFNKKLLDLQVFSRIGNTTKQLQ